MAIDLKQAAACLMLLGLVTAPLIHAQVGKPTAEELNRRNNGPGPVPGAARSNQVPLSSEPPSSDPRDFAGTWRAGRPGGPGGGGLRPGGPPGTAPAPGPPVNTAAGGKLSPRVVCVPPDGTTAGVDGPLLIVQTATQITWAAEEMHSIRRIYLTGSFTADFKPNFLGEAIGHWEENTLVVETRGLKGLPAGARMIEHWSKSADGRQIEMRIEQQDASGAPLGAPRTQLLNWAPGDRLLEWMCEDYNDEWLPGGQDYNDQVSH
ncbi:MAG: hypothetical protein ABSE43_13300 [Steroidobacteraceae bacterium]|jgi:hypothetical protein